MSAKPPTPGWMDIEDLNVDEKEMMMLEGRIDPTGKWVMPAPAVIAKQKEAEAKAYAKAHPEIPKPPPGVIERIKAAQAVQNNFSAADTGVAKTSDNGEVVISAAVPTQKKPIDNPDWAGKPKESPIEFADKERFLAHLLGGKHFTKTYDLFGGKLSATFRTLTCSEQEQCGRQIYLDNNHETTWATDDKGTAAERVARFAQYLFTASLAEVSMPDDVPRGFKPFEAKANVDAGILSIKTAHKELQDAFPYPVYRVLMNAHGDFAVLTHKLGNEAQNPSFWSPDAGT